MQKQKAPIYMLSRSKAPKHSKCRLTDIREKPMDLFNHTGVVFSSHNNFTNIGSFAKVSIPVKSVQLSIFFVVPDRREKISRVPFLLYL